MYAVDDNYDVNFIGDGECFTPTPIADDLPSEIRDIDPAIAQEFLDRAIPNRKVSRIRVKRYAKAMREGKWALNGESIKISPDGELLDGQHRLLAVIEAGVAVKLFIVFNVSFDALPTVDSGRNRSSADSLTIFSELTGKSAQVMASGIKSLISYDSDDDGVWNINASRFREITNPVVADYYNANKEELDNNLKIVMPLAALKDCRVSAGDFLFFYTIFSRADASRALDFVQKGFCGCHRDHSKPDTCYHLYDELQHLKNPKYIMPGSLLDSIYGPDKSGRARTDRKCPGILFRQQIIKCWESGPNIKHRGSIRLQGGNKREGKKFKKLK
ncbi:hypothetical protein GJ904_19995 [Salmonella enterica]|nr:hypothetical protein [Salmonella enterica subsp. enterica serovar Saintpaul]EEC1303347.1 hypothetical protein [Salmonella enterica]